MQVNRESVRAVLNSAWKQHVRKALDETVQSASTRDQVNAVLEDVLADLTNKLTDQLLPAFLAAASSAGKRRGTQEAEEIDDMMLQFELEDEQKRLSEASQQRAERLEVVQALRTQFKALLAQEVAANIPRH